MHPRDYPCNGDRRHEVPDGSITGLVDWHLCHFHGTGLCNLGAQTLLSYGKRVQEAEHPDFSETK